MTDSRLRSLRRSAAVPELADPGALLAATLRAGEEPSLDLLARAADAAGRPRPVLWLCMQADWRAMLAEELRGDPSPPPPRLWHRVSVDLGLVAQAGRMIDGVEPAVRLDVSGRYVARGLPLRSPCGAASYDVSQVRLRWAPGPVDGARGWCKRCEPVGPILEARALVPVALERALGLACAVPHPWDRRGDTPPGWTLAVGEGLVRVGGSCAWLYRLAAARIPLEGGA